MINTSNTTQSTYIIVLALTALLISTDAPAYSQLTHKETSNPDSFDIGIAESVNPATMTKADWSNYSKRLIETLTNENKGLQQSALQRIIRYGSYMENDRETVLEIVKIYRSHDDDRMRHMAVIALGELNDKWAMDYLKRAVHFEESSTIAHSMKYILKDFDGSYQ